MEKLVAANITCFIFFVLRIFFIVIYVIKLFSLHADYLFHFRWANRKTTVLCFNIVC
uniref:7TM_GPCR_Srx domain-containing protein n=1 Tax=Heterorhabditis bacteriophora TaxID=37862 RepID=A0A1I7W7S8_HETBA